jgi:hypothetical protein
MLRPRQMLKRLSQSALPASHVRQLRRQRKPPRLKRLLPLQRRHPLLSNIRYVGISE